MMFLLAYASPPDRAMDLLGKMYARLPVAAQHAAVSGYGLYWRWLRFGPGFARHLEGFRQRERWSAEIWHDWTAARLAAFLGDAALHVPYYRESWNEDQKRAARDGRLDALPLLEKEPLRGDPQAFVRTDKRRRTLTFHTSGSTGTPIASIWTVDELRASLALREARSAAWAGTSFRKPRATFSGRMIEPRADSRGPFYRFNRAERQVYFSAFHLSNETAPRYVAALARHDVRWLTGYAVSLYTLARAMRERGLDPPPLDAVVTTSEKLTPSMRATMTAAYDCPVFEEYSTVENAVFASECAEGSLHVSPDGGIVEILRPDGMPCEPGEPGEVIATGVLRQHQPLVRFRLGDVAAWAEAACPCGRALPVLAEVVGRVEDVVIGTDGREMVRFHGVFVDLPRAREGQIVQEALDRIRVLVVPAPGFATSDTRQIVERVRQRLGGRVEVEVEVVESIPRTAAGKFQAVVSKLPPEVRAAARAGERNDRSGGE